jgi:D-sedoheptulose 7-phosphate isomerase
MDADRGAVCEMLDRSAAAITACRALTDEIVSAADCIAQAFEHGHKLLICGNGGSAADAQHFAGELMGRFLSSNSERGPRPAIALSADTAVMTCIGNDFAFEDVFARQVQGLAQPGDVVVGISTSGSSPNVIRALEAAPPGAITMALCGPGGRLAEQADIVLAVPCEGTAPIQAAHIAVIHAMCMVLEARFADSLTPASTGG